MRRQGHYVESPGACECVGYLADVCVMVPLGDPSMTPPPALLGHHRRAPGSMYICGTSSLLVAQLELDLKIYEVLNCKHISQ